MSNTKYSVCVVGLGTVGLPTARYISQQGFQVVGYDISLAAVEKARSWMEATTNFREIPQDTEVFVVCVTTRLLGEKPDISSVYDACRKITNFHPDLVAIESTVPLGTCRRLFDSIFEQRIGVAHVPHRFWPQDPKNHGVKQNRVIGAVNSESMRSAKSFYSDLDIPLFEVRPIEIAEICKIAENSYRYLQIAFAEELQQICRRYDLNFNLLRDACNSKWNNQVLEARQGIGGTCLPKDIRYVVAAAKEAGYEPDLLLAAIRADGKYVEQLMEEPIVYA